MEKQPRRELAKYSATAAALAAVILLGQANRESKTEVSPDDTYRQGIYQMHRFTPEAISFLMGVPFTITNKNADSTGGGFSHFTPPSIEVFSHQHEAIIHESAHHLCKKLERENPVFDEVLKAEVKYAADHEKDTYYKVLYYGDGKSFKGLKDNVNEMCASVASAVHEDPSKLPDYIEPLYTTIYQFP